MNNLFAHAPQQHGKAGVVAVGFHRINAVGRVKLVVERVQPKGHPGGTTNHPALQQEQRGRRLPVAVEDAQLQRGLPPDVVRL